MKIIRFLGVLCFFVPFVSNVFGASNFQNASQLLAAARRGDTQTVQILINSGADINYVDSTGLSLVCTAVMNNDKRAIQVLQMYGADASKCDRQIKQYKQKSRVAARGEEYGFFSGLSSSHVLALSVVGAAAVIGGVALLTDAFDSKKGNSNGPSGGSHSGSGGGSGGSSSAEPDFTMPYGPAYLTATGAVDTSVDVNEDLVLWDGSQSTVPELHKSDYNYFRPAEAATDNFVKDGLVSTLLTYLLIMGGYYSFVNGYMGQFIFRDKDTNAPILPAIEGAQKRPVRVALITGNGINPAGSADSASGITYAISTSGDSSTPLVDKYLNNNLSIVDNNLVETENSGFDLSGSGSAFNPYANANDSALAKIVAGWEGVRSSTDGDLYGFVPNGQLAVYRTGNGTVWDVIPNATSGSSVGTFTDVNGDGVLSSGDNVKIGSTTYNIVTALSQASIAADPEMTIAGVTYDLSSNSKIFIGQCGTDCPSIAIYVGTDGGWYVKSTNSADLDNVYIVNAGNIYVYKTKTTNANYTNFTAMAAAAGKEYTVVGDTEKTTVDLIANTNILDASRNANYLNVDYFTTAASVADVSDLKAFYRDTISSYYGTGEGQVAHTLFYGYSASQPMIIMPAGERLYATYNEPVGDDPASYTYYLADLSATFENYAPLIYGNNLKHNFMTVVAVSNANGTADANTISGYSNANGSIVLSQWIDATTKDKYMSRKCGLTGTGNGGSVDPWCFAAAGPTAEIAAASAAGAVASVKSAFSYMTNDQIFTLLALTADGPYLGTDANGNLFTDETLETYLKGMYELPLSYNNSSLSYLDAFKEVFGYGLINLERAITPEYSVYYYSGGKIVDAFWGKLATGSIVRSSTAVSSSGRNSIRLSFYDMLESTDGSLSLPRIWNTEVSLNNDYKHGLYMGDVLAEFDVDSSNKHTNKIGNITFDMAMSPRAYNDNLNGLNDLKVAFSNEHYDIDAQYQRYLTDGESRFNGRANGVLSLVSNGISTGAKYKSGNFAFGAHAFSGTVTDENLLENDPVVSSQYEPARLGFANGGAIDMGYNNDKFGLNVSFGNMNETNTVLGAVSDGLLSLNGANTQYIDTVINYKPFEKIGLSMRATFANTRANLGDGIITELSDIKSNAFAFGADAYGFNFTAAMPLAVVDGKMGYDYADLSIVDKDGKYDIMVNNPHTEYIDLSAQKRELRFSGSYKQSIGEFTDAGIGFIYRVNPGNTNAFGNESIFMFKLHHRLGI